MIMKKNVFIFVSLTIILGSGIKPLCAKSNSLFGSDTLIKGPPESSGIIGWTPDHSGDLRINDKGHHSRVILAGTHPVKSLPSKTLATLPIIEPFATSSWPVDWTEQFAGDLTTSNWFVSNTNYAGGAPYEAMAADAADEGAVEADQDRLVSPPFSTAGLSSLNISFRQRFSGYSANDVWIKVQSSSDGVTWSDEWSVDGSSDISAQLKEFTITSNLGGTTWIAWTLAGATYDFDIWVVDNISISAPLAHDVKMVSLDNIPANLVLGSPVTPKATVMNWGANPETFSVTVAASDGYSSTVAGVALSPGGTTQVTFNNWNPALGSFTLQACTVLATDMDPSNNCKSQSAACYSSAWSAGTADPIMFAMGSGISYTDNTGPTPTGYLYSIGGNGSPAPQTMNCYNVSLNTWTLKAPLPQGRVVAGTARIGTSIYVIGGYGPTPNVATNSLYKYDIPTNTWNSLSPLPIAIAWGKAATYQDRYIYFAGGYGGTTNPVIYSRVYLYDTFTDTWVLATPMPGEKFGGAFSVVGNQLVYIAGFGVTSTESSVFVGTIDPVNPAGITWAIKSNFPAGPMYRFDGALWGDDGVIVTGGTPTSSTIPAIPGPTYLYIPSSDTWIMRPTLPVPVYGAATGSCNLSAGTGHTWKLIVASGGTGGSGFIVSNATQILTDQIVPQLPVVKTVSGTTVQNGQSRCFNALQTVIVSGLQVQSGGSVNVIAGQNIIYLPGTTVQSGGYMRGYIAPSGPWCTTPSMPSVLETEDIKPVSTVQSFFTVYPNPTTGKFILELTGESPTNKVKVYIYGMRGENILTAVLNGERIHEFSLSDKPLGVYFIRVLLGDKAESAKIIKQ